MPVFPMHKENGVLPKWLSEFPEYARGLKNPRLVEHNLHVKNREIVGFNSVFHLLEKKRKLDRIVIPLKDKSLILTDDYELVFTSIGIFMQIKGQLHLHEILTKQMEMVYGAIQAHDYTQTHAYKSEYATDGEFIIDLNGYHAINSRIFGVWVANINDAYFSEETISYTALVAYDYIIAADNITDI